MRAIERGEEFRDDLRHPVPRRLRADLLRTLTQLDDRRSALAVLQTAALTAAATGAALHFWHPFALQLAVIFIGTQQHAMFVLMHEAAHYRLFAKRGVNDAAGRLLGTLTGMSMCSSRVVHRLHHNDLYGPNDPDIALHGGYPRGKAYLLRKLAADLAGINAWKTFRYFFGNPALNVQTGAALRPLDVSLAIANVAVASSALGYLVPFFPALGSTQVTTTIGIIALLWITTAANFGGPKLTGRIGSITVWGVILPVGFISIAGWVWFSGDTFAAAWNPNGVSLLEGMGSSIALTLWAFLGMESASQNASAVENPKRDVPLACLFGTLGAAAVYILSTAVSRASYRMPNSPSRPVRSVSPSRRCSIRQSGPSSWGSRRWLASVRCSAGSSRWRRPPRTRQTTACSRPSSPRRTHWAPP